MFKNYWGNLFFALLFLLIAIFLGNYFRYKNSLSENMASHVQDEIIKKETFAVEILDEFLNIIVESSNSLQNNDDFIGLFDKYGIEILAYKNDTLFFWSDNEVPFNKENITKARKIIRLKNGYYYLINKQIAAFEAFALILVKYDYPYQNNYLKNEFHNSFRLPGDIKVSFEERQYNVRNNKGEFLFSLYSDQQNRVLKNSHSKLIFLIYLLAFLLIINFLYRLYRKYSNVFKNELIINLVFAVDLIILRIIIYYFQIPAILYNTSLFSPGYLASSVIFPSLGDAFVNIIILLIIVYILFRSVDLSNKKKIPKWLSYPLFTFLILVQFAFVFLLEKIISNIIINSGIDFALTNVFDIDLVTILALLLITTVFLIYFLLTVKLAEYSSGIKTTFKLMVIGCIVIVAIVLYLFCDYFTDWVSLVLFSVYLIGLYYLFSRKTKVFTFGSITFFLILFSFIATYLIFVNNQSKNHKQLEIFVEKLSSDTDPIFEYNYHEATQKIKTDSTIRQLVEQDFISETDENLISDIANGYFAKDYWNNFDIYVTACAENKVLNIQPEDYLVDCYEYFDALIAEIGDSTNMNNLYNLEVNSINKNFLGIIEYGSSVNRQNLKIFIEFLSKFVPQGLGYPELLIGNESDINEYLQTYSFAKYSDEKMVYKFGNYLYSVNLATYKTNDSIPSNFVRNKYDHYFYRINPGLSLIVSEKTAGFFEFFSPFSYVLILFVIYVLIFFAIANQWSVLKPDIINFRKRLQISIILIVFISFLLIGSLSVIYIINLNNNKTDATLREKSHSVLIELEHKLADYLNLTPDESEYLYEILNKFSQVFFTDINLYDINGLLLASSRSQIFDSGLKSWQIDEKAYQNIMLDKKLLFIQKEKIGNYEYLSAYLPFRNNNNELIAILNLPYFAKQDELKAEISTFITAFINVYLVIFAIAVFVTIIVSRYITKPLQLIREKIGSLKIGRVNEKIDWERNDEIGALVHEYNRMLDELARSAELLARSERESAWREMAKQVAHEIKNPLTPIKLNVQYLKRTWDDKSPEWDRQFRRITSTLIEQIDILSSIASEFSDFAKMPVSKNEKFDLIPVIKNSASLYKSVDNIKFNLTFNKNEPHEIFADKKQITRVFNNLFENASQAMKDQQKALVDISLKIVENSIIIRIKDNGPGIDEEIADKIFSPNFTTKSGGMGLGLALVKSIIVSIGGEISYESKKGKGTEFIITLQKVE